LKPSHMQKKVVQWFHVHKEKRPKLLYLRPRCVASQQICSKILKKDQYFVLGSYQGLPCKDQIKKLSRMYRLPYPILNPQHKF
jgi:hypothetical protein